MSEPIRLFISYSHKDEAWLLRLKDVLKPLTRNGSFDFWDDKRIAAGDDWRDKIDQALESAHAAILLVSTAFLASDFINDVEMTKLLKRRVQGMGFFWIPITDTLYEETALERIQSAWDPQRPLALIQNPAEQEGALVQIARKMKPLLNISKEEYRTSYAEEAGGPPPLGDGPGGATGTGHAPEVKHSSTGSDSGARDTDGLLVTLIDRQEQESPIQQRTRSPKGPTLFVVPGPDAQKPSLFLKRLMDHTFKEFSQESVKRNLFPTPFDIEWPSFPASTAGSKAAIDMRLKRMVERFTAKSIEEVDSVYGETLDVYAARAFKKIRDTNPATLHIFVLQLVNPNPNRGECEGFARFTSLWRKFCAKNKPSNILIIFVVSASRAEFDAGLGMALKGFQGAKIVEEMPNILRNDINTWLRNNRLSARFNTDAIEEQAYALEGIEQPGVPMSRIAKEAERWLREYRIKK